MKVAVLGYGTVGVGVYEMLVSAKGLECGPVLVRPGKEDKAFKVSSLDAITSDPEVGAVAAQFPFCTIWLWPGKAMRFSPSAGS